MLNEIWIYLTQDNKDKKELKIPLPQLWNWFSPQEELASLTKPPKPAVSIKKISKLSNPFLMVFLSKEGNSCFQESSYRKSASLPVFPSVQDAELYRYGLGVLQNGTSEVAAKYLGTISDIIWWVRAEEKQFLRETCSALRKIKIFPDSLEQVKVNVPQTVLVLILFF